MWCKSKGFLNQQLNQQLYPEKICFYNNFSNHRPQYTQQLFIVTRQKFYNVYVSVCVLEPKWARPKSTSSKYLLCQNQSW